LHEKTQLFNYYSKTKPILNILKSLWVRMIHLDYWF